MKYVFFNVERSINYLQKIQPMVVQIDYWFFKVMKSFNKLVKKLQSLNIQTCEANTTSKAKYVCLCVCIYIYIEKYEFKHRI